jgi:hypothetical protein
MLTFEGIARIIEKITPRNLDSSTNTRKIGAIWSRLNQIGLHFWRERSMTGDTKGSETSSDPILHQKIRSIYASRDESAVNQVTKLLANALRTGDDQSRSALREFLDVPTTSPIHSDAATIDLDLLYQVRLFMNGPNANRVQTWISLYVASAPNSQRRSLFEAILRNYVAVEALKCRAAEVRTVAIDALSKCAALERIIKSMPKR